MYEKTDKVFIRTKELMLKYSKVSVNGIEQLLQDRIVTDAKDRDALSQFVVLISGSCLSNSSSQPTRSERSRPSMTP